MSFYDGLVINIILVLFPIFIFLLYVAYSNNIKNIKNNKIIFDVICLSSIFLLIKFRYYFPNPMFLLLINIPLVLCFIRKRYLFSIIITIIIIIYYKNIYNFNIYYMLIEYIIYYLVFLYLNKKNKNMEIYIYIFSFLKGIVLSYEIYYILPNETNVFIIGYQIFLLLLIFYSIFFLVNYLLEKGEQILSLNQVLRELKHEKELRNSLFKITHEIKNPIAVCKGYVDMMDYNDIEKIKKYNYIIKNEIDRTLSIMDDFLDYTKIKVNLEIMDLTLLLEETIFSVETLLNNKNIILQKSIPEKEIYINGDFNRLKQVLINIIKNSIEAIERKNGKIILKVIETNNKAIISIEDNGIGIKAEDLSKISEAFFTTKKNGTGLGMSLSTEMVKLHNGTIKYESKYKKGTKVLISLHKID